ncbi:MAG: hypothetical protein RL099_1501 [Bacteroidota bacterium]
MKSCIIEVMFNKIFKNNVFLPSEAKLQMRVLPKLT